MLCLRRRHKKVGKSGDLTSRPSSAMTFAHCVSLAFDDLQTRPVEERGAQKSTGHRPEAKPANAEETDRVVALVLEGWGSKQRVQSTWSDGTTFDRAVTQT